MRVSHDAPLGERVAAFLAARMRAEQRLQEPRCWGISSDALALYGVGQGERPTVPGWTNKPGVLAWTGSECGRGYPHDEGDLMACEITYAMAPREVRERMLPVLEEFERYVRRGINRYGEPVGTAAPEEVAS